MSLSVERSTRQSEGDGWRGWAQRSHVSNNYPSYSNNRENMSACKADMPPAVSVFRAAGFPWLLFLVIFPVLVSTGTASAKPKEDTSSEDIHPLALKEEMIRDRFQRFEDRVYRLREQLADPEPDNASRLGRVLQRAGELGLAQQLDQLIAMLRDSSSLHEAMDVQDRWLDDADRLLAILLERDSDNEERDREIERLQAYHEKLMQLLEQEQALRNATAQTELARRMNEQLDQAIDRIDALLDRQAKLTKETKRQAAVDDASRKKVAGDQTALSRDTGQLGEDLTRLADQQPDDSSASESMEAAKSATKAAAQSVQRGAGSMAEASEKIQSGHAPSAQQQQAQATESLQEARRQLTEAKRRLEEEPDPSELAQPQDQLAQQTEALSQQMQQDAAKGSQGQGQGQSGDQQNESSPGQQSLGQAQREMKQASEKLSQSNPAQATENQDRAIEELEQAQRELEEALSQLRQEERMETLRDLETRFREMLSKQLAINETTFQLDQIGQKNFTRAEQLQLAELAAQEQSLSQEAATCLHILDEDGTTIVFPRVVEQLSVDMATVVGRLAALNVSALTQAIEKEIIDTLEQLLESVQRMQQENEQQQGAPQDSDDSPSPLLPQSAELKLLRSSQVRVNTRTTAIRTAMAEGTDSKESLAETLQGTARRQRECAEAAEEVRKRKNQP